MIYGTYKIQTEYFKNPKRLYMPIDPKQQPPYYTPGTMPTPPSGGGSLTRLNTQYADVVTSGTTETTIYTYNMPANTLSQNGDTIKIYYTAIQTENALHRHRPYLNNNQYATIEDSGTTEIIITITIIRTSSSTARITIETTASSYQTPIIQTESLIDFTVSMPIELSGQCPTTGTIQGYSITIDKISI